MPAQLAHARAHRRRQVGAVSAGRAPARPLAYVAPARPLTGKSRQGHAARALAAVLEEFGMGTHIGAGYGELALDNDSSEALDSARLVVCDLVNPDRDMPVEVPLARLRGVPVVALIPRDVTFSANAAEQLAGARVLRYERQPQQILGTLLAGLLKSDEAIAA